MSGTVSEKPHKEKPPKVLTFEDFELKKSGYAGFWDFVAPNGEVFGPYTSKSRARRAVFEYMANA